VAIVIRPVEVGDLPNLRLLNEDALPAVNRISLSEFDWFRVHAPYFRVVERDDSIEAFLIALTPGLKYDSANYRWFETRYDTFVYVDRIVVAEHGRGQGVGRTLYEDLARFAEPFAERLTCEVNLRPPNPGSILFHEQMGFHEVGRQETEGGMKEVLLMERGL